MAALEVEHIIDITHPLFDVGASAMCVNNHTHQESMSSPNPTLARPTLKLKIGARKSPRETRTAPAAHSSNANKSKPGAHWSDEYKQRMQADMDRLMR